MENLVANLPKKVTTRHRVTFAICLLCYLFGGLVSTLLSVYLPVVVRDLLGQVIEQEMGNVGAYIGALFLYGWVLGGIGFGLLADRFGRVNSFISAVVLYAVSTLLIGMVTSWPLLVVYRFVSGAGVGGVLVLATILVAETWPRSSRSVAQGVLAVAFPVGIIVAGLVNNLSRDWRSAFQIGWIPLVVAGIAVFFLQEPAVWKDAQAFSSQNNGLTGSGALFQSTSRRNLLVGSVIFGTMLIGLWAIFSWLPTWVQSLFSNPALGQQERGLTMVLLGSGGIIGGGFSGLLVNRLGYRPTLMIAFAGSFVMCVLLFGTNFIFSKAVYLETAALALFFGISQGALSAYLPELFPTAIRATATGFCFNIGRLATATVVFFVGTLVTVLGGYGNAVLVFSVTFLVGLWVLWLNPNLGTQTEKAG
jgi:MFS family permease